MPSSMVKALKSEYLNTLQYQLREKLRRKAEDQANAIATELVEKYLSDEGAIDNYFKLIALLEQDNTKQT